jgi:tetratricopeptide (TPR) repeat protein
MKKHMLRLIAAVCIACAFLIMPGCADANEDSGAYDAAVAAFEKGDYETAVSEFQNAADNDGRTAEAYRGIGIIYLQEGNYEYAANMFDLSLSGMKHENRDFEDDVLLYKAEALINNSETESALEIYDSLKEGSRAGTAYALEGSIFLERGDTKSAQEDFDKALESEKSIAVCLMIYEAYKDADLEGYGAGYLETAVSMEAETGEEYMMLGRAYDHLDNHDNACQCLNTAIDMGCTEAVSVLGNVYFKSGDISSAKSLFMEVISEGGDTAMAYNGLAMCAIEEEDYESALVYVQLGLDCEDDDAERSLLFNEVIAYEKMLDFETAEEKAEAYMEKYPSDKEMEEELRFLSHS